MRRRKKAGFNPTVLIIILAVAGIAAAAFFLLRNKGGGGFDGVQKLDPEEFLTNNSSMRGNTYQVTATVSKLLKYADKGRLYHMAAKPLSGGDPVDIPVLFPEDFAKESINVGQEMTLKVEVNRDGLLRVLARNP